MVVSDELMFARSNRSGCQSDAVAISACPEFEATLHSVDVRV